MGFCIEFAGSVVHVAVNDSDLSSNMDDLAEYLVPSRKGDKELVCRMVEELSLPCGELVFTDPARRVYCHENDVITYMGPVNDDLSRAYLRVWRKENRIEAEFKRSAMPYGIYSKDILRVLEVEHVAIENNGFVLHASCIEYQGEAILFTAPSGTGKSTQADIWNRHRGAEIINGDRIMVQILEEGIVIRGIPFSGSSGISKNRVLPLKAIVYLRQAPENRAAYLHGAAAFRRVWEGCSAQVWNREEMDKTTKTVLQTVTQVPVLLLECTPDVRAVETLEAILNMGRESHA